MIYSVKALFWKGKKVKWEWSFISKDLELEQSKIEKFSPKYREKCQDTEKIGSYYCIKNINYLFAGNRNSNNHSYFEISFYPYINGIKNSAKCFLSHILENSFRNNYIEILFPDVELNPQIYKTPVKFWRRGTYLFIYYWKIKI